MKKILCTELGFRECNWEFIGQSDDDVVAKARDHGKRMHNAEPDDKELRAHIRNA